MGSIYEVFCQDCGYSLRLRWGVGMLYQRPDDLPGMLPKKQREKVREMLDRPDCSAVRFSRDLMICPVCGLPASRLDYRIEFEDGEVHQPSFRCGQCRTGLVKTDQLAQLENCPRCGSQALNQGMGDWD